MSKMKNSGVEWIGEIPDGWEVYRNKNAFICNKEIVGKNSNSTQLLSLTTGGIKCKDINNAEGKFPESFDTYQYVKKNDVVMCLFDLDMSAVFSGISQYDGMISPAYKVLSCQDRANPLFVHYWFSYIFDGRKFNHYAKNIRYTLNYDEFATLPILLPPKSTQQRIASYLDKKCSKIEETIQNQQQVIEKLKAYKQSLITEAVTGKIKIQNGKVCGKYESYKDSGVEYLGKIPSKWNIKRLRYIGKCQNGISKGGEFFGSGYPFVSYGDVYNNLTLPETVSGLIESTPEEQENYSVMAGEIFFTRTSETIEEVGFTSVCLKTIEKATFAGFVIRVRPFTEELVPDYSKYYFSSDAHRRFFVKEMNLVTRASLNQDLLKRLPVLIPSKDEQKEIADYLDKKCTIIDTTIEQKQKLIEKLTEYKKSLIYECVTGKKEI